MSKRAIGLALLAIGSVVIGLVGGHYAYRLFDRTVPPAVITDLVRGTTRAAYMTSGIAFGALIFGWTVAAVWLSRFFAGAGTKGPQSPTA